MRQVALSDVKDDLSRYLRQAAKEEIVITRHGKAAGLLIGFESEDDCYPCLEPEDIAACLTYAARRLDHRTLAA